MSASKFELTTTRLKQMLTATIVAYVVVLVLLWGAVLINGSRSPSAQTMMVRLVCSLVALVLISLSTRSESEGAARAILKGVCLLQMLLLGQQLFAYMTSQTDGWIFTVVAILEAHVFVAVSSLFITTQERRSCKEIVDKRLY